MKYAIIELAGRQFMVKEGDVLEVTRQDALDCSVLFYKDDSKTIVGMPCLDEIAVELEKLEDKKDHKVMVARFRAKSRHRRKKGHRQPISVIKVKSIGAKSPKAEPVEPGSPVTEEKTPKKVVKKKVAKENDKKEEK